HVAHAEDAADDAIRVEWLEGIVLFAHADELDWLSRHLTNGERRTASGVAVHLGQHNTGDRKLFVTFFGGPNSILAGHGVRHEENLLRIEHLLERLHLRHQL